MDDLITPSLIARMVLLYTSSQSRPTNASFGCSFYNHLDEGALKLPLDTFSEIYLQPKLREIWPPSQRHDGKRLQLPKWCNGAIEFYNGQTVRAVIYYDLPTGSEEIRVDVRIGDWRPL